MMSEQQKARIAELEWEKQHLLGVLEIVREEIDKRCAEQEAELERTREALAALVWAAEDLDREGVLGTDTDHGYTGEPTLLVNPWYRDRLAKLAREAKAALPTSDHAAQVEGYDADEQEAAR